jgi:hypothetical protein
LGANKGYASKTNDVSFKIILLSSTKCQVGAKTTEIKVVRDLKIA